MPLPTIFTSYILPLENGVEDVVDAVESAIDSWLNYYEVEREKWLQLKAALRH
jgi:hypothetical protein